MKQPVLVVDDEVRNQRMIGLTLDTGVDIINANSGEQALTFTAQSVPDLILLDIVMPGMDGYETCRTLRRDLRLKHTRIILLSGKASLEERLDGYQAGADDYITKPFVPEELQAKVRVFLRLARAERELEALNEDLSSEVERRTRQLLDTEARMITSNKMAALGEMAAGIAHEINTPLGTIGLQAERLAELIEAEPVDREAMRRTSAVIGRTVGRIGAIVRSLRTFARDGEQEPHATYALNPIIESTLDLCREKLYHSGIEIRFPSGKPDLSLVCSPVQLSQVFMNLIGNACDAVMALDEKWLEIDIQRIEERVFLRFTDSGTGVPDSVREKMFNPFFTTKEIGRGTGLGLSISRQIIDAHHGRLELDTNHAHTSFTIDLPPNG